MITDHDRSTARRLWHLLEPIHAVTYFSPETTEAYKAIGLKGFWQGCHVLCRCREHSRLAGERSALRS